MEIQTEKYSEGLPAALLAHVRPLPFLYQSTGVETFFTNRLDPAPRSRRLFHFHRPDILAAWSQAESQAPGKPSTLRSRLQHLPALPDTGLWAAQRTAVQNLKTSFADDRPRALIQMATGSGKTYTAPEEPGQHTQAILANAGFTAEEIAHLRANKVVS